MKKITIAKAMELSDNELLNVIENYNEYRANAVLYCYAEVARSGILLPENVLKALKEFRERNNIESMDDEVSKIANSYGVSTYKELYQINKNKREKEEAEASAEIDRQNVIHPSDKEIILMVFHDVMHQNDNANTTLGDIIFSNWGVYFIGYAKFQLTNVAIGAALGGVIGGFTSTKTNNDKYEAAYSNADKMRAKYFGTALDERISGNTLSKKFIQEQIESIKYDFINEITITTKEGKKYAYSGPALSALLQRQIDKWPNSVPEYDSKSDPDGFLIGISLKNILKRVAGGDTVILKQVAHLGNDETFCKDIYKETEMFENKKRKIVIKDIVSVIPEARLQFLSIAKKETSEALWGLVSFILLTALYLSFLIGNDETTMYMLTFGAIVIGIALFFQK